MSFFERLSILLYILYHILLDLAAFVMSNVLNQNLEKIHYA